MQQETRLCIPYGFLTPTSLKSSITSFLLDNQQPLNFVGCKPNANRFLH